MTKYHYYKGYLIEKPYGSNYWNIREIDEFGYADWCFAVGYARNLKEARESIDYIEQEKANGTWEDDRRS